MDSLHLEMASQECANKLLGRYGLDQMFYFSSGIAVSFLGSKHVKHMQYAYQLTLAWLYEIRTQAYDDHCWERYWPCEPMEMWKINLSLMLQHSLCCERIPDYQLLIHPGSANG